MHIFLTIIMIRFLVFLTAPRPATEIVNNNTHVLPTSLDQAINHAYSFRASSLADYLTTLADLNLDSVAHKRTSY